jgi:site-specific DNA-methyltransferase (adenine-specific)
MPEQLLGRIIRSCSNADDVVLDPFSGSCTTLAAAKKLGRQFLGFEMSKEYAKLGKQRLEAIRSGDRLDGSPEPKASAPATYSDKARRLGSTPSDRKGFVHLEFDFETFSGQEDALVAAFANANRGFSVDRVIADPTLNQSFQNQCEKLAVQGTPAERNRMLFRLRHAGELKRPDVEMSKVTKLDWSEVDRFLFGSEIAWRKLIDLHDGLTLDELFADPNHAAEFDTLASAVAPGATPLQYRWAAIMLRKQLATFSDSFAAGEDSASHVDALADGPVPDEFQSLSTFELEGVPTTPGVYLLRHGEERWLFAGETMNLRARLSVQLAPEARLNWPADRQSEADVFVSFVAYPSETRLADQVRLVKQFRPEWNLPVD